MSTSTVSAAMPRHPFERRVDEVKPSKADINAVIMDYLIHEGYPAAARKFSMEANIPQRTNTESIQARVDIRNAIHAGDIRVAIEKINELSPDILDCEPGLHFALLRLQLIELIRASNATQDHEDIVKVLNFASTHLAPRAPTDPEFKKDLEKAMSLLVYPAENLSPRLAALLDPQLRQEVANKVNEAILRSQGVWREAKIKGLVKLRAWAEQKCRESKKDIPSPLSLGLDGGEQTEAIGSDGDQEMNGNGDANILGDDVMVT